MLLKRSFSVVFLFLSLLWMQSCSDNDNDDGVVVPIDSPDPTGGGDDVNIDRNSLATNGCANVVIFNNHAYAACGQEIEIVSLTSLERNLINFSADDIAIDEDAALLFTQAGSIIRMFNIDDPLNPVEVTTASTNFGLFSGIGVANGILVISAGTGGSNTQVFRYTDTTITLATNGIPAIDGVTGNPDVMIVRNSGGGATAYYSQDLGAVANWGIQPVVLNDQGEVLDIPNVFVLTPRQFGGNFGPFQPANFPVESEFLENRIYVAHFGVPGLEIIDLSDNSISQSNFSYEPTNIATDGNNLFVVGVGNPTVDIFNPIESAITSSIQVQLQQATGVAASEAYIAVADRNLGLIIVEREEE